MATAYPAMYAQQPKGTLMPGQMISVNKYNVQVERFLSQGGFAHVYLVRTAEPVFNTTRHVLKRIAVSDEAMLNDVKKEVDIMRILRGHPNIVYLIDAAWHRMPNGMFEVFILMEFCSGGGIIDMMNRRLRERLTEAEILHIFVDACEGVAAMHNLRPALLHRDLKVENILQASATSYKLCDFGSAIPVSPRSPSSMQEIRALEADLNKHTTLQYRAPEMVDVFLRRPVDEKSDVWALGVLLYKLCYYTTPFEEHGILAILNVQYKFPPYPVYSQQLSTLIASMLQEHGGHRPSVFETLETVHRMRGTKSRFTYSTPPREPLSPKKLHSPSPSRNATPSSMKSPDSVSSPMNGIQAREKVLEAIAPMRRGRPSSPTKVQRVTDDVIRPVEMTEDGPWNPAKAYKSGLASISVAKNPAHSVKIGLGDAWEVPGSKNDKKQVADDSNRFGDTFDTSFLSSSPQPAPASRPAPVRVGSSLRPPGDAFDSLQLFSSPRNQAPTLGEAQKAGLTASDPSLSSRPSSRRYSVSPSSSVKTPSPLPTGTSSPMPRKDLSPLLQSGPSDQALAAEHRFPSLEELDAGTFGSSFTSSSIQALSGGSSQSPPQLPPRPKTHENSGNTPIASFYPASVTGALRPSAGLGSSLSSGPRNDGVRSQHVTGTVMRDSRKMPSPAYTAGNSLLPSDKAKVEETVYWHQRPETKSREKLDQPSRPILSRKHRSSVSVKHTQRTESDAAHSSSSTKATATNLPKDWLTGANDEDAAFNDSAVLRASPEKHTSVLHSSVPPNVEQEAVRAVSPVKRKPVPGNRPKPIEIKKSLSGLTENWSPVTPDMKSSSSSDESPEDATGLVRASKVLSKDVNEAEGRRTGHKSRQGSVHDLVDLWGGSSSPQFHKPSPARKDKRSSVFMPKPSTSNATIEQTSPSKTIPATSSSANRPVSTTANKSSSAKPPVMVSRKPSLEVRRPSLNHLRQSSSPAKARQLPSSPAKSRPQSMMIMPVQKSISEHLGLSSPALTPPADRVRTAHRRSSISDIVSRYEAIGVLSRPGPAVAPSPAAKPARLRVVSPQSLVSPTAASAKFPLISPTNSPVSPVKSGFGSSLDLPARSPTKEVQPRRSVSPNLRSVISAFQNSPSLHAKDLEKEIVNVGLRPSTPLRMNTSPLLPKEKELTPTQPVIEPLRGEMQERLERDRFNRSPDVFPAREPARSASPRAGQTDDVRSPSPERPYQGVSKLINQWQKKTEEADTTRGGGAGGIKGPGSRFRREAIAAGGGKAV
ncbi:hypothetical protein EW145_g2682 [Phellinidium pouzarii]|uniref:non-specific serine/threonine protein kinase n=1 Tax=Phellinidium pouzarii TaxID=167371 RepID=A0A4S4LFE4_9AGAM|nr:hypothetical protein EW145_g2682 [Phellinidium pouzarii]